jgi:hypothetical protein
MPLKTGDSRIGTESTKVEVGTGTSLTPALTAIAEFTQAVDLIQAAVAEIDARKSAALEEIETRQSEAVADIQTKQAQAIAMIQLERIGALQALQTALPNVVQLIQQAVNTLFGKNDPKYKGY